jgi:hypothetical protein
MRKVALTVALIAVAGTANAAKMVLEAHNQISSGGTLSSLIFDGSNNDTEWGMVVGMTTSDARWEWDGTMLSSTGLFWTTSHIGSNPNGLSIISDKVVGLSITPGTMTTTATTYECVEGSFLGVVGAHGCANVNLDMNFAYDSSMEYNVGGDPTHVKRTLGGDDTSTGDPRSLTTVAADPGGAWDAADGAFDLWTIVQDDGVPGGALILSNGVCMTPGDSDMDGTGDCPGASWLTFTYLVVPPSVAVLEDINDSGDAEAVVAMYNGDPGQAIIKDSESGDAVATVDASAGLAAVDVEVISDLNGNGSDDIAFLLLASTDSQPKVEVRDPLSGARIKNVNYNKQHDPVALAIVADQNGNQSEEGVVLARQLNANDRPRLLIRDLSTKAKVNNLSLPKIFDPLDVVMGPDLNGNGSTDAYVLSTRISDGKGFVNVWDTGGAGKIVNVQLPKQTDVLALDDLVSAGGANAVTVLGLRTTDNVGRVFVYDSLTAAKIWAASQAQGRVPIDIKAYTNGAGAVRVAALQLRSSDQRPVVTIYNGNTGAVVTNVFYESGEPVALTIYPDVSSNNEPELGVLFDTDLRLRDSVTKAVVSIISVP